MLRMFQKATYSILEKKKKMVSQKIQSKLHVLSRRYKLVDGGDDWLRCVFCFVWYLTAATIMMALKLLLLQVRRNLTTVKGVK